MGIIAAMVLSMYFLKKALDCGSSKGCDTYSTLHSMNFHLTAQRGCRRGRKSCLRDLKELACIRGRVVGCLFFSL